MRHPVDLFALLPLGELSVAAARLGEGERMSAHVDQAWSLLAGLGEPVVWATPLHWYGVHAAILAGRPDALEPHAKALVVRRAAVTSPASWPPPGRRGCMSSRARSTRTPYTRQRVDSRTSGWPGTHRGCSPRRRHAAPTARRSPPCCRQPGHCRTSEAAAAIGETGDDTAKRDGASGQPATRLSPREIEVAQLLLGNRTYREIGDQLFISPKTVEHHVARIKQRIGATDRSELFARLRVALADRRLP